MQKSIFLSLNLLFLGITLRLTTVKAFTYPGFTAGPAITGIKSPSDITLHPFSSGSVTKRDAFEIEARAATGLNGVTCGPYPPSNVTQAKQLVAAFQAMPATQLCTVQMSPPAADCGLQQYAGIGGIGNANAAFGLSPNVTTQTNLAVMYCNRVAPYLNIILNACTTGTTVSGQCYVNVSDIVVAQNDLGTYTPAIGDLFVVLG